MQRGRNYHYPFYNKEETMPQTIQVVPPSNGSVGTWSTSQKDLIVGLLTIGHKPISITFDGRTATYSFDDLAKVDADKILRNEDVLVNLKSVFAANVLWAATLTRASELSRQMAVSQ